MLIDLLSNGAEPAQERAVRALLTLVEQNPDDHQIIASSGKPDHCMGALHHCSKRAAKIFVDVFTAEAEAEVGPDVLYPGLRRDFAD